MNNKTKFLIGLVAIFFLIGLIFGTATIVRFCKLQSILNSVKENVEKDNFYMKTTIINKGVSKVTETYYKDGVGKFVAGDGTYIWFDGEYAYSIDENNKKAVVLNLQETIGVVNKESFASLYPGYTDGFFERLMFAGDFLNKIKTDYHNGKKCIVIAITEKDYTKTFWITKELYNLVKAEIKFANGDTYEYKYNLEFHVTKNKDIRLPNMSEYTITDSQTGENIETNTLDNNKKLDTQNVVVENIITDAGNNPIG